MSNLLNFPKRPKGGKGPSGYNGDDIKVPAGAWAVAGGAVYWMQMKRPNFLIRTMAAVFIGMSWCDIDEKAYRENFKALKDRGMLI